MNRNERIFVDGLATVKLSNGVVQFEFFNNAESNGATVQERCGQIVMPQQAFLQAYGTMEELMKKMIDAGLVRRTTEAPAAAAATVAPPVYAKRFKTLTGLFEFLIRSENHIQLTACSGKSPVCLKPRGFT